MINSWTKTIPISNIKQLDRIMVTSSETDSSPQKTNNYYTTREGFTIKLIKFNVAVVEP